VLLGFVYWQLFGFNRVKQVPPKITWWASFEQLNLLTNNNQSHANIRFAIISGIQKAIQVAKFIPARGGRI